MSPIKYYRTRSKRSVCPADTTTLKKVEIHAEIQLLFYCELKASELPPRVICSSKDACFLCNALIFTHGNMHTPRSHGRLYPGWRLPFFPKLNEIEQDSTRPCKIVLGIVSGRFFRGSGRLLTRIQTRVHSLLCLCQHRHYAIWRCQELSQ
jgi:hypothetical protein